MRKIIPVLLAGTTAIALSGVAQAQDRTAPRADLSRTAVQERAAEAFQRMDINGDGKIDAADREARVKARFDRVDANGDGAISYAEYTAMHGKRGERPAGARAEGAAPGNDRIERRGMRGHAMGMRGMGRNADANADGTITRTEFEAALLARFDAADADNNGIVTAAERKARPDAMRGQWRERRGQRTD